LAVAVTAAHVLVFRMESLDDQPRWIALACRSVDVKIELVTVAWVFFIRLSSSALGTGAGRCADGPVCSSRSPC